MKTETIKDTTVRLLTAKQPRTYESIVERIHAKHPGAQTSVKTVQWYASRLRADGTKVTGVRKLQGGRTSDKPKASKGGK